MTDTPDTSARLRYPGGAKRMATEALHAHAPALGWYTDAVLFAQNWERPELAKRDRSIITCAALVAGTHAKQMVGHFGRALDNGVTPVELQELITHLAFYAGWPCAMTAAGVMMEVYEKRGITAEALAQADDALLPAAGFEDAFAAAEAAAEGVPAMAGFAADVVIGDLWRRPQLAPRDRALVTITLLIARGEGDAFSSFLPLALGLGLTREEIAETITHLAFYAGWPVAEKAARRLRDAA